MKLYSITFAALMVSLSVQAAFPDDITVFNSGMKIISASPGSNISSIQGDDIRIPEKSSATIYSEENNQGTEQYLIYGEVASFPFKSLKVSLVSKENPALSLQVERGCVSVAFEKQKGNYEGFVNLYTDEITYPSQFDSGNSRRFTRICDSNGLVDLMAIAQKSLGKGAYGSTIFLNVEGPDFTFSHSGKLPDKRGEMGSFNEVGPEGGFTVGYSGNLHDPNRVMELSEDKSQLTVRRR